MQPAATGGKKRVVRIEGVEFVDRFLLHVLPTGFERIRHYGLLAPAHKAQRSALARTAPNAPQPDPIVIESVAQFMQRVTRLDMTACPHCGKGHFVVTGSLAPVRTPTASSRGPPCA